MFSLSSSGKKPDSTNFQYQNQAFCFINHPKSLIDQAKSLNDHPICLNDHPKSLVDEAKSVVDAVICFIDEVNRVMDEGFRDYPTRPHLFTFFLWCSIASSTYLSFENNRKRLQRDSVKQKVLC